MLYDVITADIKSAMIEKNVDKKNVLKQIKMKSDAIVKESKSEMTDEVVQQAIAKELKQLNQTFDAIKSKTDSELYISTVKKIEILKTYLPKQLSEDEIKVEIEKIKRENFDVKSGQLLGIVMKTLKGKADNKLIKSVFDSLI
jgi:uncharacterized protein YqeY